jgi:hypothetical protein
MELYEGTVERQSRLMKTIAAAMGADISDDYGNSDSVLVGANDIASLPMNLGYTAVE